MIFYRDGAAVPTCDTCFTPMDEPGLTRPGRWRSLEGVMDNRRSGVGEKTRDALHFCSERCMTAYMPPRMGPARRQRNGASA